ncbi:hypothetical protein NC651_006046 [Populus alba x Populus x berolinensis]|nr:hypothetical protein NC651_006046 [Populus alba x Populus x berolinensis]
MVGNKQKKSSFSSFFSCFKARKPRRAGDQDAYYGNDDVMSPRKIRPFDDDNGPLVSVKADPRVDYKASVFIDNFHAARIRRLDFPASCWKGSLRSIVA